MNDNPEIIMKLGKVFIDLWIWFIMGLVTIIIWFGKRQFNRFDSVVENYVHKDHHDEAITELEMKMLSCQETLKADQKSILTEMRHHVEQSIRQSEQIISLHARMDTLTELIKDMRHK